MEKRNLRLQWVALSLTALALTASASAPGLQWKRDSNGPVTTFEASGRMAYGKLYIFGGFVNGTSLNGTTRAEAFDVQTNTWKRLADLPEPLTHTPTVVDGDSIYLCGGRVTGQRIPETAHVWRYRISLDKWELFATLPRPVGANACALSGRRIHVFAGFGNTTARRRGDATDHVSISLDEPQKGWTTLAPMPMPRDHLGYAELGGLIYAVGGERGFSEHSPYRWVHVYDPVSDSWKQLASLPVAKSHIDSAVVVWNGLILLVGGENSSGNPTREIYAYSPSHDSWTVLGTLPISLRSTGVGIWGDRLYVATGGVSSGGGTNATFETALK